MPKKSQKFRKRSKSPIDLEAQPVHEEVRQRGTYEMSTRTSVCDGDTSGAARSNSAVGQEDREDLAGLSIGLLAPAQESCPSNSGKNDPLSNGRTSTDTAQSQPMSHQTPSMIGDFDDSANALWSHHMKEAKGHGEAQIKSLKDNMDSILIFAGLFSAALTSFLVDKIHDLQVDPAQQMVYYQQQNVALLAQISNQVASIAPQVSIPSTPPPPYPDFTPTLTDVRVSVYWSMSLVFSISAALFAALVQRWIREYMHVFRKYSNPLKSARLRQYLYEGIEGWYMPMAAEFVPGFIHVSLFLFFLGLGDWLLAVHTTVGITAIIPIAICGALYVFTMLAPVLRPQSPYQNSFSGTIWHLRQKALPRRYSDRESGGALGSVSKDMSEGRVQLAMEENDERKDRDVRAIEWLIQNRTEDDEMESFMMAIPGTFTSQWGIEVWRKVSEVMRDEDAISKPNDPTVRLQTDVDHRVSVPPLQDSRPPRRTSHPHSLLRSFGRVPGIRTMNDTLRNVMGIQSIPHATNGSHAARNLAIHEFCKRVRHLLDTCDNRSVFPEQESWRKRARGCVKTVVSLVIYADLNLELFGDLGRLLCELGESEKINELSAAGSDGSFVTRWTCLSLVVVARGISRHDSMKEHAASAINDLSMCQVGSQPNYSNTDEMALQNARNIDNYFEIARGFCVNGLREVFEPFRPIQVGWPEEQVRHVLVRDHKANISTLERIGPVVDQVEWINLSISKVNHIIRSIYGGLNVHLPGVSFDELTETGLIEPTRFFNHSAAEGQVFTPQLVFLRQRLRLLCSYSPRLLDIIGGQSNGVYEETLDSLRTLWDDADREQLSIVGHRHLMERQLWRLIDIRDSGGFGFSVELFFLALARLFSRASSWDNHSTLYIGTFRAIISDWGRQKHSIGTQRVILNVVCDVAITNRGIYSDRSYPRGITNELLVLLGNMVEGQSGSHIDDAMMELGASWPPRNEAFAAEARAVISLSRAQAPSS